MPENKNLIPVLISKEELLHVLQGGKLLMPAVGIQLEPDVELSRMAHRVRTRIDGASKVAAGARERG